NILQGGVVEGKVIFLIHSFAERIVFWSPFGNRELARPLFAFEHLIQSLGGRRRIENKNEKSPIEEARPARTSSLQVHSFVNKIHVAVPAPEFSGRCQAVGPALDISSWQGPSAQQHKSSLCIPSLCQTCGRCRVCQFPPVSSQSCFP